MGKIHMNSLLTITTGLLVGILVAVVSSHPHQNSHHRNHGQNLSNQHHRNKQHYWRQQQSGHEADVRVPLGPESHHSAHHNSVLDLKPQPDISIHDKSKLDKYDEDDDLDEEDDLDYDEDEDDLEMESQKKKSKVASWNPSGNNPGRHSYLMKSSQDDEDRPQEPSSSRGNEEDSTLNEAFIKHMQPTNEYLGKNPHDVYAYKLPSDLWFIVRYKRNPEDGQIEKYMNVVPSFTNYLDKLDNEAKSVSVNVKGVETVFRLTAKKPRN